MNWIKSFFEESPGVGSMTRAVTALAFLFCIALPLGLHLVLSHRAGAWIPIPETVRDFCLWGFAAAVGGKVAQTFGERSQ